ncbi:MAG: hypothetical protein U0835_27345 [Isosphaeraceae bacterium]
MQAAEGLANIRFLDYFREQLHASLSLADVHLISMRHEMTGIVVPGKLYGVMASRRRPPRRPGPLRDRRHHPPGRLRHHRPPGRPERAGRALTFLASDAKVAETMGANGSPRSSPSTSREACSCGRA